MNIATLDEGRVIQKTAERYDKMQTVPGSIQISHGLSRQVQALAEVLVEEINYALSELDASK